jgi:hypothetical protein
VTCEHVHTHLRALLSGGDTGVSDAGIALLGDGISATEDFSVEIWSEERWVALDDAVAAKIGDGSDEARVRIFRKAPVFESTESSRRVSRVASV